MFQTYICLKNIYLEIVPYSIRTYICPYSMYIYSEKMVYGEPLPTEQMHILANTWHALPMECHWDPNF